MLHYTVIYVVMGGDSRPRPIRFTGGFVNFLCIGAGPTPKKEVSQLCRPANQSLQTTEPKWFHGYSFFQKNAFNNGGHEPEPRISRSLGEPLNQERICIPMKEFRNMIRMFSNYINQLDNDEHGF